MLKIGLTGPQSTGKSTVLAHIEQFDIVKDNFFLVKEITRQLGRYGYKINEEGDDRTQLAIMKKHRANYNSTGTAIFDRSVLDGVVYTQYMYNQGNVSDETMEFARQVFREMAPQYDVIFYFVPEIPIEDDGVRSASVKFRDDIEAIFQQYLPECKELTKVVELRGNIEQRAEPILDFINRNKGSI
jgi:nicotinamide riboside kinase